MIINPITQSSNGKTQTIIQRTFYLTHLRIFLDNNTRRISDNTQFIQTIMI